jgi:periplasmic divalent cation tolerance protein
MERHVVVFITAPSAELGAAIGRALVEQRLAACASIVDPIRSIYAWRGLVEDKAEVLLVAKTRADVFESKLVPAVRALHPYEVPEIIALPIVMGAASYLNWIDENVEA